MINITFPAGFVISSSYCVFDSKMGSSTTCTVSGLNVIVSGFISLSAYANIYIKVFNIINPSGSTTGSLIVTSLYNGLSTNIDYSTMSASQLFTSPGVSNTTISSFSFFPISTSSIGELTLKFNFDTSVPKTGALVITFPSNVAVPNFSGPQCKFNLQFLSCESSGNVVTIQPVTFFSAGIDMKLIIPQIIVPSIVTTPISIISTYSGITLSQTSSNPGTSAYFSPASACLNNFVGTLSILPTNLGEPASYTFSIPTNITSNEILVIWLPSAFPLYLGDF